MRQRFLALLWGFSIYAACGQPLQAQTANSGNPDYDKQVYLFVSHGVISGVEVGPSLSVAPYSSWQIGGTAERFLLKGLAIGAELAATPKLIKSKLVTYTYRTSSGKEATVTTAGTGFKGWGSANLSYHFKGLGNFVPFVTGGVTLFARDGLGEATNYGGGLSLWMNRHRGLRLEYRKYAADEGSFNSHFRSVRIGLVLR